MIRFVGMTKVRALAMLHEVMRNGLHDLDILWPVVSLDAILVVRDFAWLKLSSEQLLGDEAMLVSIPTHVGEVMADPNTDKHISV